jgi:hypothetical protein
MFHQVLTPLCVPPAAEPRIDVTHPNCVFGIFDTECYQWPGNLAVDENTGDVYVTYNTVGNSDPPHNDDVVVTRVNGGASRPATQADVLPVIAANDRPDTFDSFTVVAVDRASNVYVVWSERHPESQTTDTMLAVSKDRGVTWGAPIKVNNGPQTTTFPWIVAGDAGKIDIVYYGTSEKGPSPEEVPATSKWRVWMAQSLNALDARPSFKENPANRLRGRDAGPARPLPDRHRRGGVGEHRLHRQPQHAARRGRSPPGMDHVRAAEGRKGLAREISRCANSALDFDES